MGSKNKVAGKGAYVPNGRPTGRPRGALNKKTKYGTWKRGPNYLKNKLNLAGNQSEIVQTGKPRGRPKAKVKK